MSPPSVAQGFPVPSVNRKGWPWQPERMTPSSAIDPERVWPKISIVTPSYNQAEYLEEALRSVLMQGYANLEYIVIDGGSTDASVDIIQKYEPWLAYWGSEGDSGQSEAINKGFQRASGDIVAWINSDDYFLPSILEDVAHAYSQAQQDRFWVVYSIDHIKPDGARRTVAQIKGNNLDDWLVGDAQVNQQGSFWSRAIFDRLGYLDEKLRLGMDTEYFMRLVANGYRMEYRPDRVAAVFRIHDESKTGNFHGEIQQRSSAFKYDWALAQKRHLPKTHPRYAELRRRFNATLAHCETRFGQDTTAPRTRRLGNLLKAAGHNPREVLGRAYLGGWKRLLTG